MTGVWGAGAPLWGHPAGGRRSGRSQAEPRANGLLNESKGGWTDGQVGDGRVGGWMVDRWMGGRMGGWVVRWVHGEMEHTTDTRAKRCVWHLPCLGEGTSLGPRLHHRGG